MLFTWNCQVDGILFSLRGGEAVIHEIMALQCIL